MMVSTQDKKILRGLAQQKADIAALDVHKETIDLWTGLNGLKPSRPMVMIDQIPWHEMDVDDELKLQTEDSFSRSLEVRLRRELYQWKHMRVDQVVEASIDIPRAILGLGFGIEKEDDTAAVDSDNDVESHHYKDLIKNEDDLEKIKDPNIRLDEELDRKREELAHDIFDGILEVNMRGGFSIFNYSPWDRIVEWRGTDTILIDILDEPDFIHKLVARIAEVYHMQLDQLEEQGLLGSRYSTVHCTGAYADELPSDEYNPEKPTAKDNWTFGMAQIFASVSPAMHKEFEIEYSKKWYQRFGLGYYGCCEPLDMKIDIIRALPNVRKISMSPWVDVERGAEAIGPDYVYSRKPSPSFLAWDDWRPEQVRKALTETKEACDRHGCPVEFILKDISTARYEPQRLWEWAEIAMEVAQG